MRMFVTLTMVVGLGLLSAAPVAAQSLGEVLRHPPLYGLGQQTVPSKGPSPPYPDAADLYGHKHDDTALWVFVAAASADWSVTMVCFEQECGTNTKGFTTIDSPSKASAVGLLIDGAFGYFVREWVQPDSPRLAQVLFYGAAALRAILVTHKITDLRRLVPVQSP